MNNLYRLLYWFLFVLIISFDVFADQSCEYTSEIEACTQAFKSGMTRNIEDFVCINDKNPEKRIYQIILDLKFKDIDDELNWYLSFLDKNKDYYFWKNKKESYMDWQETIESKFNYWWEYRLKYKKLCDLEVMQASISCLWWKTTNVISKDFLWSWGDCIWLAQKKLDIYKKVAYDLLKLNKDQVRKDDRKEYVQKERTMYDTLLDLFNINIGYLERVWMKWPTKTKNPY